MGELEGAMSSLAIAVAGLMTLFIAPLFKHFLVLTLTQKKRAYAPFSLLILLVFIGPAFCSGTF